MEETEIAATLPKESHSRTLTYIVGLLVAILGKYYRWLFGCLISLIPILILVYFFGPAELPVYTPRTKPDRALLATATYLVDNPVPTQAGRFLIEVGPFLINIDPVPGSAIASFQQVGVDVVRETCMGAGAEELCREIDKGGIITVDGQPFEPREYLFGSVVGSTTQYRFGINLSVGPHLFELELKTPSGEVYSYLWVWIVDDRWLR
jgi:hypothetical protein